MGVEIRQVGKGGKLSDFLSVVELVYRGDENYVRPLNYDIESRLSRKNPFFEHAEAAYFTAHRDGACVGRCSVSIDQAHLQRHKDGAGFFGFFDTVDDAEVARALMSEAKRWLHDRGMSKIRGPFSLGINEESGCLVDGFDTPPMVMMPHHRRYQGALIEAAGLSKVKDLFAWRYRVGDLPRRVQRAHDEIEAMPEVYCRQVDLGEVHRDARIVMDIHQDAWSETWGFVPISDKELEKFASDLRLILDPAITAIAYVDGEPAAMALSTPNLNAALHGLNGRLSPLAAAKLYYRIKVKRVSSARLALLGIKKKFRVTRRYAGLSLYLYAKLSEAGRARGYEWGELGWTLEDNGAVNAGIRTMGGKRYKTYRLYEAEL